MSLVNNLNNEQKEAVLCTEGPLLVLAGAGSGKTRVLTHRIAYLIKEKDVDPYNIIAITFTNKAAKEMKERVLELVGSNSQRMIISTFHSACVRFLRRDIEKINYGSNFNIYDTNDSLQVLKKVIKDLKLNDKNFNPRMMLSKFGKLKDQMISSDDFMENHAFNFYDQNVAKIYKEYQKRLKNNNAIDFDDIIYLTVKLFLENPQVLAYYNRRFRYILVDEYQDTNKLQFKLIELLASSHRNLCVVGDDDQSIFMWRGADVGNILGFENIFDDTKVIKLEQNYRSTGNILNAANAVIKNNYARKEKALWTSKGDGDKIEVDRLQNEYQEGRFIASKVKELVEKGRSYSDFAVLYRMNVQSRSIEEALSAAGIRYKIFGGHKFYDRKEVKDVLAYLKLIYNESDYVALERALDFPKKGIGTRTVEKVMIVANDEDTSAMDIMRKADQKYILKSVKTKLIDFTILIDHFKKKAEEMTPSELIGYIIEKGAFREEYERREPLEYEGRIENIEELVSIALEQEKDGITTLSEFLENVSLVADIDDGEEASSEFVSLMTMHSAKGLEFPIVFIAGFEENIFPSERSLVSDDEMEEERRLCYVGITRAMEQLYLTNTSSRTIFGRTTYNNPSRFLSEIPEEFLDCKLTGVKSVNATRSSVNSFQNFGLGTGVGNLKNSQSSSPKFEMKSNLKPKADESFNYSQGDRVIHKRFGIGKILSITMEGEDTIVEIDFEQKGMRRLVAAYAKLEKM